MTDSSNIFSRIGFTRVCSTMLMVVCLIFLTSLNYFLYPNDPDAGLTKSKPRTEQRSDIPPSGPTEEKASSGFSLLEEFLHDPHPVIDFQIDAIHLAHATTHDGQVIAFDGELLSPPPEA